MRLIRDSVSLFVKKITEMGPEYYVRDVYGFESENGEVVIPIRKQRLVFWHVRIASA